MKVLITNSKETEAANRAGRAYWYRDQGITLEQTLEGDCAACSQNGGEIFPKVAIISALPPWCDLHTSSMRHLPGGNLVSSLRSGLTLDFHKDLKVNESYNTRFHRYADLESYVPLT